jgi:DNA-binding response OmpR family regulator
MKNILIIEDNADLQKLYTDALSKKDCNVICQSTAKDGLLSMEKQKPDLVVLDIMLPGGENGFDVLEKMKKDPNLKNVPVLVVTNLDTEEKTARDIGVTDYIVKTNISFEEIVNKILSAVN